MRIGKVPSTYTYRTRIAGQGCQKGSQSTYSRLIGLAMRINGPAPTILPSARHLNTGLTRSFAASHPRDPSSGRPRPALHFQQDSWKSASSSRGIASRGFTAIADDSFVSSTSRWSGSAHILQAMISMSSTSNCLFHSIPHI